MRRWSHTEPIGRALSDGFCVHVCVCEGVCACMCVCKASRQSSRCYGNETLPLFPAAAKRAHHSMAF